MSINGTKFSADSKLMVCRFSLEMPFRSMAQLALIAKTQYNDFFPFVQLVFKNPTAL